MSFSVKKALFSAFIGPILQHENSNDPLNYGETIKQHVHDPKYSPISPFYRLIAGLGFVT